MDPVQIYFNITSELEKIGFADLWSWYEIKIDTSGIKWQGDPPDFNRIRPPNILNRNDDNFSYLDQFGLHEEILTPMPIYFDLNLVNAKQLVVIRSRKYAIVGLYKYNLNSNRKHYCSHLLFSAGCWRSDKEIICDFDYYEEASKFHGIFTDSNYSEIDQFFIMYINYMINSNRYSPGEIARNI